ncbi:PAS domain-containing protein [Lutimaribacter marinistellae]|uniref:PAS domain-containing protein n=1 Tax=Lutimaribacter marinistellae TaxID=1820329 RepID=A0ABV7TLM6_9RHOB
MKASERPATNRLATEFDEGNVVFMDRFRTGKGLSPIRQAEAYWQALRHDGDIPRRSDVDPRGLGNILSDCFILERIAPGIARFRLAGQTLNSLAGMEVRGMPLTAFFTPSGRREISAVLEHVFDAPAIAQLSLAAHTRMGRPLGEARMVLLPLRSDQGEVSRALGVMLCDGIRATPLCHLSITQTDLRKLGKPAREQAEPILRTVVAGFSEDQKPLVRPALRLVSSQDN